jgi:hypothetical protein
MAPQIVHSILREDDRADKEGCPGEGRWHCQDFSLVGQAETFGNHHAQEHGGYHHGEQVGTTKRSQDNDLNCRRKNANGNGHQQVGDPRRPAFIDLDVEGAKGTQQHKRAMRKVDGTRGLVNYDQAKRGQGIDGPELQTAEDDEGKFSHEAWFARISVSGLARITSLQPTCSSRLRSSPGACCPGGLWVCRFRGRSRRSHPFWRVLRP